MGSAVKMTDKRWREVVLGRVYGISFLSGFYTPRHVVRVLVGVS